ncbi:CGG triplet repeat-binding protein 1-like [Aphis craccivora]|uniref:CGG triplet repeat-binding protein 1-like n=1 Tax=Aphis craccivora TaxID=307492 RepID=A0A6G0VPP9_APHCR|nr:CGG triplet repeat-binding protein 1-like [Aphis craccivora]
MHVIKPYQLSTTQRFQVTQHIGTAIHIANKQRKTTTVQQFITSSSSNKSTFNSDLCTALIKSDIPLRLSLPILFNPYIFNLYYKF